MMSSHKLIGQNHSGTLKMKLGNVKASFLQPKKYGKRKNNP